MKSEEDEEELGLEKQRRMQLSEDNQLLAELVVAEKLGKTLVELREQMTPDELMIWLAVLRRCGEMRSVSS